MSARVCTAEGLHAKRFLQTRPSFLGWKDITDRRSGGGALGNRKALGRPPALAFLHVVVFITTPHTTHRKDARRRPQRESGTASPLSLSR